MALYGVETSILREIYQKYLERFEMWCWRRMDKIIWTDRVRNEEVLYRVKEKRNTLRAIEEGRLIVLVTCSRVLLTLEDGTDG
jgi:hypothetical protein